LRIRSLCTALGALSLAAAAAPVWAKCKLDQLAELPVTMSGLQPLISAKVNGVDATFLVDSGAFNSLITPAAAAQYQLKPHRDPIRVEGAGGAVMQVSSAHVEELRLADRSFRHVEFIVAGSEVGSGVGGVLGRDVLSRADAEYDLASGVIRLMQPSDGCGRAVLAYWAKSEPISVIDMPLTRGETGAISGTAYLNGNPIHVLFDTGADTSFLTRRAAERAGFTPTAPGVVSAGVGHGIGAHNFPIWIANFESLKLGEEEIHNARLEVGDADMSGIDMLLGADFFLSHHIYVANGQDKVYFTYNGGPVFNLRRLPGGEPATERSAGAASPAEADVDEPNDAAGLARRGAAYAARQDFEHAIADLTRACELAPTEASYFRQRGLVRWRKGQPDLAKEDLDQALKLKPDDVQTLLARAKLSLASHDTPAVVADLQAADRAVPKESNVRLQIADLYTQADALQAALAQYDLWIAARREDAELARAKNGRCWVRALMGSDLEKALDDCDDALGMIKSAEFLDSRGLVLLRLGKYDRSIADYDAALKLNPRIAWSLYGRGVARMCKGMTAEGQADIAAAIAIQRSIAEDARKHGLVLPDQSAPVPPSH